MSPVDTSSSSSPPIPTFVQSTYSNSAPSSTRTISLFAATSPVLTSTINDCSHDATIDGGDEQGSPTTDVVATSETAQRLDGAAAIITSKRTSSTRRSSLRLLKRKSYSIAADESQHRKRSRGRERCKTVWMRSGRQRFNCFYIIKTSTGTPWFRLFTTKAKSLGFG